MELTAKELRIGDIIEAYVKDTYNDKLKWKIIEVSGIESNSKFKEDEPDKIFFIEPDISTFNKFRRFTKIGKDFSRPILLTSDWFINFGFKKEIFIDRRNYTPIEKIVYRLGNKLVAYNEDGDYMYCQISDGLFLSGYSRNIKFVHELQNLHFELKREELTLKK